VRNTWIIGTIVGQTVVTLVSIGYGLSAHSSWEAERQRRVAGERAAVAEMATALKGAGDRIVTVEQELQRCQVRLRRANRSRASSAELAAPESAPPVALSPAGPSPVYSAEAFPLASGPLSWTASPTAESGSVSVAASPTSEPRSSAAEPRSRSGPGGPVWCEGRYEFVRGTNFAPCPSPLR
jgi:hypothetical protein